MRDRQISGRHVEKSFEEKPSLEDRLVDRLECGLRPLTAVTSPVWGGASARGGVTGGGDAAALGRKWAEVT